MKWLRYIPRWGPTAVVLGVILTCTLLPGDDLPQVPAFPGADKVVHALMFGVLAAVILYDIDVFSGRVRRGAYVAAALISTIVGGCIELLQDAMGLGRTAEWLDFAADACGSFLLPLFVLPLINLILRNNGRH